MRLYWTETEEDFDALMEKLSEEGVTWTSGLDMEAGDFRWGVFKETFCVRVVKDEACYGSVDFYRKHYPETPIIKYVAEKESETRIDINDFVKEVHQNAVQHGWWEEDRDFGTCATLSYQKR